MPSHTNHPTTCFSHDTIGDLIQELKGMRKNATLLERMAVVKKYPLQRRDFERHIHPNPTLYHREILETSEDFQLLILTWMAGQKSPIHNHRGSQCIVHVLQGFAIETVYDLNRDGSFSDTARCYPPGSVIGGADADIHTIENAANASEHLVTMHIYFPALEQMELFEIKNDRLVAKRRR